MSSNSDTQSEKDVEAVAASETVIETGDAESPGEKPTNSQINDRRGRMITAGLLATVVLAVIAILVSGIFQLTSRWLIVCPRDLPVNDPAPILWQDVLSQEPTSAKLGVPKMVASQAGFKSGQENSVPNKSGN